MENLKIEELVAEEQLRNVIRESVREWYRDVPKNIALLDVQEIFANTESTKEIVPKDEVSVSESNKRSGSVTPVYVMFAIVVSMHSNIPPPMLNSGEFLV